MQVTVEHHFDADRETVWDLLVDVPRMAALSPEVVAAAWLDDPGAVGSRFTATNRRGGTEWQVTCHVLESDRPERFAWCVSDPERRSSTWSYDLAADGAGTLVTQTFAHGPGMSLVRRMVEAGADAGETIGWRSRMLAEDMAAVLVAAGGLLRFPHGMQE